MALNNLFKKNNYKLNCLELESKIIVTNNIDLDNIDVNNIIVNDTLSSPNINSNQIITSTIQIDDIYKNQNSEIILHDDLIPINNTINLGSSSSQYNNIYSLNSTITDTLSCVSINSDQINSSIVEVDNIYKSQNNEITLHNDLIPINDNINLGSQTSVYNSIYSDNIYGITGTQIKIGNSIVPYADNQTSVGTSSLTFNNLYCRNIWSHSNAPVKATPGIILGSDVVTNVNNSTLNIYYEQTGTFTLSGCYTGLLDFSVTYRGVIIGKVVNMAISIISLTSSTLPPNATNNQPIILEDLPLIFVPNVTKIVPLLINVNNTYNSGAIQINSASTNLTIYSSYDLNSAFITGREASYAYPNGTEYSFSYILI